MNAHVDSLCGEKVVLDGYYPDFSYRGRNILHFFSTHPRREKILRLLPQFLYDRVVERHRRSSTRVHDALQAFFNTHDVDVVLAEFGNVGADICEHTHRLGIPLIVHFHGHDAHRSSVVSEYFEKYQRMFKVAFRIITVSQYMTDALTKMGADPEKITLNPYGPNESFFDNESTFDDVVVAVGRFTDIKAPHLTLLAFQRVLQTCPNVKLVMGGHGELLEACQTLVKAIGIESSVVFPGALRHDQVPEIFSNACCFVQHSVVPTYGDAEGTPVAILEAAAAGLPVVSTRHAGIRDAVIHEESGFLVDERDVEGMANAILTLVTNKELCRKMGASGRAHIRGHYSIERHLGCIDAIIAEARAQQKALRQTTVNRGGKVLRNDK